MAMYSDFAEHYDAIFPARPATGAFLHRWLPPAGAVLDVGCGTGGHLAGLVASGRSGLGLDPDPGMIAEAARRHPAVEFRPWGMEQASALPTAAFAGVICIGNVLPHLSHEALPDFLAQVARLLAPDGVWIFQTVNFDPILRRQEHVFPGITVADTGLVFQRRYTDIGPERLRFETALTGPEGDRFRGAVALHPHATASYRQLHAAERWLELGHFADWRETRFDPATDSGSIFVWRRR